MTDREKAIVMAYTGYAMLTGDKLGIYYAYLEEKLGRPVMTHELAEKPMQEAIHTLTHDDFVEICRIDGEPRVMTLEEVIQHYSLPPVFVDDFNAQEDYYEDIQPLYFEFPHDDIEPWIVHWRGHAQVARYLNDWNGTYNKKWRCWTSRPTDEQREAIPWNG